MTPHSMEYPDPLMIKDREFQNDAQRVRAARAGDAAAFDALVRSHFGLLYAVLYARVGQAEAAEDLAQEAFLRAWLHLERLADPARFTPWLVQIARNLANDWLTGRRRALQCLPLLSLDNLPGAADPEAKGARAAMETQEENRALREAIFHLPAEQREMVLLHYMEGLNKKAIARRLEVHPSTVGRQLRLALASLRGSLEPILRGAAPGLRPSPAALRRTSALIAAAIAGLSAEARAAMAASTATHVPALPTAAAGGKAWVGGSIFSTCGETLLAIISGILNLLNAVAAPLAAGGKAMGLGKGLAVLISAVALVGGTLYCNNNRRAAAGNSPAKREIRGADVPGTYILFSFLEGVGLYQIQNDPMGNPFLKEDASYRGKSVRLDRANNQLVLMRRLPSNMLKDDYHVERLRSNGVTLHPDPKTGTREWIDQFWLVPSESKPGDWDLVGLDPILGERKLTVDPPLPSFLHRVKDPRISEYYELMIIVTQYNALMSDPPPGYKPPEPPPSGEKLLRLATAISADNPDDLHLRMLYFMELGRSEDFKTLGTEVKKWKPRYEAATALRGHFHEAEWAVHAHELSAAGRNGYDFIYDLFFHKSDLARRLQGLRGILNYDDYACPARPYRRDPDHNQFLGAQTMAKIFNIDVVFLLMQGQRGQAMEMAACNYRMGQLMTGHDTLITRLIGIAIRAIACRGLAYCALDGCETPAEIEWFWKWLEYLNQREAKLATPDELIRLELLALGELTWPNVNEAYTRLQVSDARFQLVRMATAARHRLLLSGMFPRNDAEFVPLLPAGPPVDPFTSETLKMIAQPEGLTCYSTGPDLADNQASVEYDPTNGTSSSGDITLLVPSQRKYPFPREGVRASTRAELLARFPNDLPPDPFDWPVKSLSISNTYPVYVYSYGPDTDSNIKQQVHPEVHYDPTNGTTSDGDLFIAIPPRE